MSYINCYPHSDVGQFFHFRVYHPLVKLDEEGFNIGPESFLFGGGGQGGGEQKSFLVNSLAFTVLQYLSFDRIDKHYSSIEQQMQATRAFDNYRKYLENKYPDIKYPEDNLYFPWSINEIVNFYDKIKNNTKYNYNVRISLHLKDQLEAMQFEKFLNIAIGEFVFKLCLNILSEEEQTLLRTVVEENDNYFPRLFDVFQPSIKNWDCSGRIRYSEDGSMKEISPISYFEENTLKDQEWFKKAIQEHKNEKERP